MKTAPIPCALLFLALLLGAARAAALEVGDPAPEFSLPASDGETYVLSEMLREGPVVLAWYPQAFTSGCTLECKSFKEEGHRLRTFDVRYFMASVDPPERSRRFARSVNADFPLLSDEGKDVARAYGVLHQDRFAFRTNFFIGQDGRILSIQRNVDPRHAARDVAEELESLGMERTTGS